MLNSSERSLLIFDFDAASIKADAEAVRDLFKGLRNAAKTHAMVMATHDDEYNTYSTHPAYNPLKILFTAQASGKTADEIINNSINSFSRRIGENPIVITSRSSFVEAAAKKRFSVISLHGVPEKIGEVGRFAVPSEGGFPTILHRMTLGKCA